MHSMSLVCRSLSLLISLHYISTLSFSFSLRCPPFPNFSPLPFITFLSNAYSYLMTCPYFRAHSCSKIEHEILGNARCKNQLFLESSIVLCTGSILLNRSKDYCVIYVRALYVSISQRLLATLSHILLSVHIIPIFPQLLCNTSPHLLIFHSIMSPTISALHSFLLYIPSCFTSILPQPC